MIISQQVITDDIRGIASSGSNPNEFRIPDEQIYWWIDEIRAVLISQSLAKKDDLNDTWLQTISCMEMEQADEAECCLAETGCYVLKTVKKIPATIDTWKANWIVSVTTAAGEPISKSNRFANKYQKYSKYTGSTRYYYLKNDYLYIVNDQLLESINVTALFQSPSDLANYVTCEDEACFTPESPYPISANMSSQLVDIIIKTKVIPYMQFPGDYENDASSQIDKK